MLDKMNSSQQPFSKGNFLMIGICCLLIIIGFLLMIGGGSSVEGGFNPDIFSTRRIVTGPLIAFIGFLLMAFAIFIDPKEALRKWRGRGKPETSGKDTAVEAEADAVTQIIKEEEKNKD